MTDTTLSNKKLLDARLFRHTFILIGLVFTSFLIYTSALQVGFIGDDFVYLSLDTKGIFLMSSFIYRPLGLTLFSLAGQWFGDSAPIVLHILGITLHAINSYLLFRFARALTGNTPISLLTAVIWLFSMTAVESIYWLSALVFYLPMTSLIFLTLLLAYNRFKFILADRLTAQVSSYLKSGTYIAVLWACSLMFHEIALVTPLVVVLMFYGSVFFPRSKVNLLMQFLLWLPTILVAAAYGIVRIALHAPSALVSFSISERARLLVYAIWRSFMPIDNIIGHDVKHFIDNLHPIALALVILFLCVTITILWRTRTFRPIAWGILATVIAVFPPIAFATVGGRHLYLSSAMGILTLGIASSIVLQQIAKANILIFKGRLAQELAGIALLSIFFVMLGMNLWRTHGEIQRFMQTSELVKKLESQVMELVSRPLLTKYTDTEPIPIFLLDFPIVTLTSSGVSRSIHRAFPELANPVQITQIYFNDHNPDIIRGGFGGYVDIPDIIEMKSSAIVLVFCKREQAVFLLGSNPIPCLTLGNN